MLSAECATPESEVIVEVSLAHPYKADRTGLEKGALRPTSKWDVSFGKGTPDNLCEMSSWGLSAIYDKLRVLKKNYV